MTRSANPDKPTVVLLHGLLRTKYSMAKLERALKDHGYTTLNIGHPCLRMNLAGCEEHIRTSIPHSGRLAFVGHSMGGILATRIASECTARGQEVSGVVALGSPFMGSMVANKVARMPLLGPLLGPAVPELAKASVNPPFVPPFPTLVIAGARGGCGFNPFLPSDNDGIVTVDETRLPGAQHELTYGVHSFLVYSKTVIRRVIEFLESLHTK